MKRVEVVKSSEVEIRPFNLQHFIQPKEMPATIKYKSMRKVSKKELKNIANALGLHYEDSQISFSKKVLNEYLKQMSDK